MPRRARPCGDIPRTSRPSSSSSPLVSWISPIISANRVLLPAPLGPIKAVTVPSRIVMLPPSTARKPPKRRLTPRNSSTARASTVSAPPQGSIELTSTGLPRSARADVPDPRAHAPQERRRCRHQPATTGGANPARSDQHNRQQHHPIDEQRISSPAPDIEIDQPQQYRSQHQAREQADAAEQRHDQRARGHL